MSSTIKKVVFLDFDGCLNCRASRERAARERRDTGVWDDRALIDPELVARLNSILRRTGAVVVISSSWRVARTIEELRELLYLRGFAGQVVDVTPKLWRDLRGKDGEVLVVASPRGEEIRAWLDANPEVEAFVVIDDECNLGPVRDHHVRISDNTGITDANVECAVTMLKSQGNGGGHGE